MKKVIYQGEPGCNSEVASYKFFPKEVKRIGVKTFREIFERVQKEKDTYGIVPVENSLTGSLHQNYDLLLEFDVWVIGEVKQKIVHNLLAPKGIKLENIKEVWSHPEALAQCREFLSSHPEYKVVSVYDTAGAAKIVKEEKRKDVAIIAGPQVAKLYGFKKLKSGIENHPHNFTRFLIISKKKEVYSGENARTMLVFGVKNEPGILFRCLSIFALRNIDLTKLESRATFGKPYDYLFYIDFRGSLENENCSHAVETLKEVVTYMKILGSYLVKD
ncbi:MAG: prephenate dehydratase [candidate division WOR-3 bacterium]